MFLVALMLLTLTSGHTQSSRNWVIEKTRQLAPEEYEILRRYEQLPEELSVRTSDGGTRMTSHDRDAYAYLESSDATALLGEMDTNIHEINHGLTSAWAFHHAASTGQPVAERLMYYYYIKPGEEHYITTSIPFFPSRNLIEQIPSDLRTFRFDTYVDGNSSTQNHGLMGLLDEYNAYFHSLKVSWLLKDAYLEAEPDPIRGYLNWVRSLNSVAQAYYEFRFFIFEYLLYARQNEPQVYQAIRNDARLTRAFNAISSNYKSYVDAFQNELNGGWRTYATRHNLKSEASGDVVFLGRNDGGSMRGFYLTMKDADALRPVLGSGRYAEVIRETRFD